MLLGGFDSDGIIRKTGLILDGTQRRELEGPCGAGFQPAGQGQDESWSGKMPAPQMAHPKIH